MPTHPSEADGECQQDESAMQNVGYGGATVVTMSSQKPDESRVKKGKKGRGKWPRKKVEQEPLVDVAEPPRRGVRSLKLTVSTPAPVAVMPPADPDEKRYCYCDQISFGEVCCYQVELIIMLMSANR
jgi:hypothetical protein